jgi:hypothetical protein
MEDKKIRMHAPAAYWHVVPAEVILFEVRL